jgi:FkbM family methyltransferase
LVRVGTSYGGWYIPGTYLDSKGNKTILSLGVGFDVSFDKELAKVGFNVMLVDPLPACISFAQRELLGFSNCYFENFAVSNFVGSEIFYPPKNRQHDAWSSINIQSTSLDSAETFNVVTLDSLLDKYKSVISTGLLYLKMDIEGAEVKVIPQICNSAQKFDFMGIELDFLSLIPFLKLKKRVASVFLARKFLRDLDSAGYKLVYTDRFNFFWMGSNA